MLECKNADVTEQLISIYVFKEWNCSCVKTLIQIISLENANVSLLNHCCVVFRSQDIRKMIFFLLKSDVYSYNFFLFLIKLKVNNPRKNLHNYLSRGNWKIVIKLLVKRDSQVLLHLLRDTLWFFTQLARHWVTTKCIRYAAIPNIISNHMVHQTGVRVPPASTEMKLRIL